MADVEPKTEKFTVMAHGTTTLDMVYTTDLATVVEELAKFEQLLAKEKKYRFIGLDLEYTPEDINNEFEQELALVQICLHKRVLVFHYCRSTKKCPALVDFFLNKGISFASMDIRKDRDILEWEGFKILAEFYMDIQDLFKMNDRWCWRDGMGILAECIIDSWCKELKGKFPEGGHQRWEEMLMPQVMLEYAARDAYMSFEMYRRILAMRDGLVLGRLQGDLCPSCKAAEMGSSSGNKRFKGN